MKHKVLVAMSGGVDSAATAALMVDAGHEVVAVTFRTRCYSEAGDVDERKSVPCCSLDSIDDARRVCDRLGIRHHVLDVAEEFERTVVDPFCDDYLLRGWTPNPCIECNGHIKFGRLLSLADAMGCDRLATGHYARIERGARSDQPDGGGAVRLLRGRDGERDQSYVLWPLPTSTLERVLLPLGELTKEEARAVARAHGFLIADKAASQEICFVSRDYRTFIAKRAAERAGDDTVATVAAGVFPGLEPGAIVDRDGREVGRHDGFANFTVGQRKGLPALGRPVYVTALDPVTRAVRLGADEELHHRVIRVERVNWVNAGAAGAPARSCDEGFEFRGEVQIRSRHRAGAARIRCGSSALEITFDEPQRAPSPGQSAVIYRNDEVICGGIVTHADR